jgi:2-methylaconitate cis-trans-isomerase PrpF
MKNFISCVWMRGGTSKGGCFLESELGADVETQNARLSRIYGSNDPSGRQIDGMGGATSTTSKAVIVGKRAGERNGVNYTFAQVELNSNLIDRKGNCGNMSSTVGPFAIEMGLVDDISEPVTQVRVFNTNTQKTIISHVQVKDGKVVYDGDYAISGVPGKAAQIKLEFLAPGGAVTKKLLPTGNAVDRISVDGYGEFDISIVDAANPLVFVRAKDLGLSGGELPKDIDSNPELLQKMLAIREEASVLCGIAKDRQEAKSIPAVPKFCFIAPPADYQNTTGETVPQSTIDLRARMLSMGKLHPVLAITGGICIGVAAKIPGTLVNEAVGAAAERDEIRIGHCSGILAVGADVKQTEDGVEAISGTVFRTARVLMRGEVNIGG